MGESWTIGHGSVKLGVGALLLLWIREHSQRKQFHVLVLLCLHETNPKWNSMAAKRDFYLCDFGFRSRDTAMVMNPIESNGGMICSFNLGDLESNGGAAAKGEG
ncbi:hypothetical protein ACFX15_005241 [Malus domestica]